MAVNALAQYDPARYNLLMPSTTIQQVSPLHHLRMTEVQANPDPDGGDVFKVGSRNVNGRWEDILSPAKPLLMKISQAAGVIWNYRDNHFLSLARDYACYEATGAMRIADGSWIVLKATKEIDLQVIEEEVREANLKKVRDGKAKLGNLTAEQWVEEQTHSNMIQWRKNKAMRAETGAILRVVRALLGMKMQYSPAELSKPFVVPRVEFAPDMADPQMKQLAVEQGLRATAALFGSATPVESPVRTPEVMPQIGAPASGAQPNWDAPVSADDADDYSNDGQDGEPGEAPADPPAAQEGQPQQTTLPGAEGTEPHCEMCGQTLTEAVVTYSRKNFGGRALCVGCQRKVSK